MADFVISDTHFLHHNIIKYCNRPFSSAEEMDEVMIKHWNGTVRPEDTVYHLGDVGLTKGAQKLALIVARLNGKKILTLGNHDNGRNSMLEIGFDMVVDNLEMTYNGWRVRMQHYPALVKSSDHWFNKHRGPDLVLHGHIHNSTPESRKSFGEPGALPDWNVNLSVEVINYTPQSLGKVIESAMKRNKQGMKL